MGVCLNLGEINGEEGEIELNSDFIPLDFKPLFIPNLYIEMENS